MCQQARRPYCARPPETSGNQLSCGRTRHRSRGHGLCVHKEDLTEVRDWLLANKVPSAAHAGAIAPYKVTVPPRILVCGLRRPLSRL